MSEKIEPEKIESEKIEPEKIDNVEQSKDGRAEFGAAAEQGLNGHAADKVAGSGVPGTAVKPEAAIGQGPLAATYQQPVLLVSSLEAAQVCAEEIRRALRCVVEVAEGRKAAMSVLRRKEFAAVVVDDAIAESDEEAAEQLWRIAGLAVPLQLNFAICSAVRVTRELRAALYRRSLEEGRARKSAENTLQADIGSALTGIVLELDLLQRLTELSRMTGDLRKKLTPALPQKAVVDAALGTVKAGLRANAARATLHKQVEAARAAGIAVRPGAAGPGTLGAPRQ
jgi:hypothetical protein